MADSSSSFFVNEESAKRYGWKIRDLSENTEFRKRMTLKYNIDVEDAVDGVRYIAEKMKSEDDDEGVSRPPIIYRPHILQLALTRSFVLKPKKGTLKPAGGSNQTKQMQSLTFVGLKLSRD